MSANKLSISAIATAENVGSGPVAVWSIHAINIGVVAAYLKLYDKADASHADTPYAVYCVPTSGGAEGGGFTLHLQGMEYKTACSFRCVTEVAHAGTTAPAANAVTVNIEYTLLGN